MALRDQPYLPLYIQDFLTDEKLMECSASSLGIYIKIMCILHKQEEYGVLLLKQKDKQSDKQIVNFASKIAKSMPYDSLSVSMALSELVEEGVLALEGDKLVQKRMRKDGLISDERSKAGKTGGKKTQSKLPKEDSFAKAKNKANSEIEYENENTDEIYNEIDAEKKSELIDALVLEFGFSEMRFSQQKSIIMSFVKNLEFTDMFNHFIDQFKNYKLYKAASKEKVHSFEALIGTPAKQFENAAWNKENWANKLSVFKSDPNNQSKFEKLKNAYDAPNPYLNNDGN